MGYESIPKIESKIDLIELEFKLLLQMEFDAYLNSSQMKIFIWRELSIGAHA